MWNFEAVCKKFNTDKVKLNSDINNRFIGLAIYNRTVDCVSSTQNILFGLCKHLIVLSYYGLFSVTKLELIYYDHYNGNYHKKTNAHATLIMKKLHYE
jgi:hypothetical protein